MSVEALIDFWEMSHVKNAAALLDDLGFSSDKVSLAKLSSIIDEELQDTHNEKEITPLLRVSRSGPRERRSRSLVPVVRFRPR